MIYTFSRATATTAAFIHLVTLINRRTDEEACLTVTTASDRFSEVLAAIRVQRQRHGLAGFEIHEALPCA